MDAIHIEQQRDRRIAYIGSGVRMVILNVTDPGNLVELGSVMLDAVIMAIDVRDGYAYIASTHAWDHPSGDPAAFICVVDVHNVTAPFLVARGIGQQRNFFHHGMTVDDAGRRLYASPRDGVPTAIDISDPTNPVYRGECGGGVGSVFVGDLQYWLDPQGGRLGIMDMSSPNCPGVWGGRVTIPEYFDADNGSVSVLDGDYLYVMASFNTSNNPPSHSQLFVVDFSNLDAPVHVGSWGDATGETLHLARGLLGDIAVSDGRLYWAGWGWRDPLSRTMVILDIATDPANPQLIGAYSSAAKFTEIKVVGTTAYLGDEREGLVILDCSDPANPVRVGGYFSPNEFNQAALDGSTLYVTDPLYGVSIVDVSDLRAPALLGKWETGTYVDDGSLGPNWGIGVRDGLAYVAAGFAGFQVLDVSDPSAPTLAGEFSPWPVGSVSVGLALHPDEPIVHVGVVPGAWIVNFDVADPSDIVEVGAVNIGGLWTFPLTIDRRSDGIAYVARDNALMTVDLSSTEDPLLLGQMGYNPTANDLAVDGDHLYAVNDTGVGAAGLDVFDVSAADHLPVPVAHYDFDHTNPLGYAVAVSNGLAYWGGPQENLTVLDVTAPASAVRLAGIPTGVVRINDLIVDGTTVYAITRSIGGFAGGGGVLIYAIEATGACCDNATGTCTEDTTQAECEAAKSRWGGEGSDCATIDPACVPPPPPTGACCGPTHQTCLEGLTQAECETPDVWTQNATCAEVCREIPTVSQWGLAIMSLNLLVAGTWVVRKRIP